MPAGDILKGKDLRITLAGGSIYHATECSFSTSRNFDEVATKDTDGTITTPDNLTWNLSTSALVANKPDPGTQKDIKDIFTEYLAKNEVAVEFATTTNGDITISGNAFIENVEITAATEGRATFSVTFRGNGNLTVSEVGA
jgi:hypothetical protein